MDKQKESLKTELNKAFSDEYIRAVGILIHTLAERFYEEKDLEGKVYFGDSIFEDCLIDILVDLARLKTFHDIDRVNYIKLIAYTASWCLRRKPFQLVEGAEERLNYINEEFALELLLQAGGCYDENTFCHKDKRSELVKNVRQIFYHLRYRNTHPQTLELFLVGLECGKPLCVTNMSN